MRKGLRVAILVVGVLLSFAVAGLIALWWASARVPEFYEKAMASDPARQKKACDEMVQRSTALASDSRKTGHWEALFTAEQINGWLATDLEKNYAETLSGNVSDPRVAITPDSIRLAFRVKHGALSRVISLVVEPHLREPNVLALQVRQARAGLLPLPLSEFLDSISAGAQAAELRLHWEKAEGDPVAIITLPPMEPESGKVVQWETLRLGDGEVYVAGTTKRSRKPTRQITRP